MIHLRVEVFVIPEKPSEGEDYYVFIYLFIQITTHLCTKTLLTIQYV